jgi:uncharacterized protein YndB with AHSA1/START domain
MSRSINSEIIINTSAEKVWNVLTDFDAFPSWNPFIKSISGERKWRWHSSLMVCKNYPTSI